MLRPKVSILLALLALSSVSAVSPSSSAVWDISPADRADYYPSNNLRGWLRFDDSAFVVRRSGASNRRSLLPVKKPTLLLPEAAAADNYQLTRERREAEPASSSIEKIAVAKSSREARMSSPESWTKQPVSVPFRHRADPYAPDNYGDDGADTDEAANLPPLIRAHYAPKTDFVTSGRGRAGPIEGRPLPAHPEGRESREMPIARSYDEYDVPIFRNVVREHDFDVQIPRNNYNYYPNRYRSQRDYYYPGGANRGGPYPYDRYRDEDEDYDTYGRYRPTPKPKRIIYYATLPEIVRKPVDLRDYRRPSYDPMVRGPEAAPQVEGTERNRVTPNNVDPNRRPLRYPYDNNYDNYVKRSSYYDRRRPPYAAGEDERARDQDRNRASFRDKMRSDERKLESQIARTGDDRRLPWPIQIGTEVSIKENERIPGRQIFGRIEGYERYEGSRVKKTSGNAERKEDTSEEMNNNNSSSNDSSNNNN